MTETTLKPCPFCENEDLKITMHTINFDKTEQWDISCKSCHARSGINTKQEAIKAWNQRAGGSDE